MLEIFSLPQIYVFHRPLSISCFLPGSPGRESQFLLIPNAKVYQDFLGSAQKEGSILKEKKKKHFITEHIAKYDDQALKTT